MNSAASNDLINLARELQSLPILDTSYLAGGTNLALRFAHRISEDIDLFIPEQIGKVGYLKIKSVLESFFRDRITKVLFPFDMDDQFIFLRAFIATDSTVVKVEILQNMRTMDHIDLLSDINLASVKDIGLFKLMSCSSRASAKDIYDLDYITDELNLMSLLEQLETKIDQWQDQKYHTIFDFNGLVNPVQNPILLLKFDQSSLSQKNRPNHSSNRILVQSGAKDWQEARISWRAKVREIFRSKGLEFLNNREFDVINWQCRTIRDFVRPLGGIFISNAQAHLINIACQQF
ncbi:MAG: nucleotidyl transferase AbiEii/AbiGii toxin family protein [Saprospiraceae bacterium]|nr:nucleotidyl transferase AbiEii/AbiGii toxin family protein [Saprospiraceae bacterium]